MTIRRVATLLLTLMCASTAKADISREDLKKALEANPDLVLSALKKVDKTKFFEFIVEAQQDYQKRKAKEEAEREQREQDAAFKNPLKPEIAASAHVRGPKDAPITIVEYSDFQCPYCKQGHLNLEQLRKKHGDKLRVVFKNFPLSFHPLAMPAAQWFEAVALQSPEKAWIFHDTLFANQNKLGEEYYKQLTKDLGLDVAKAAADAGSDAVKNKIEADVREAKKFGIEGTPAYLINGVPLRGAYPPEAFEQIFAKIQTSKP
ncbi:MAG: thioredoxin domain-containing protein [Elusimicrobia bacterium]|nr:thioredoxin domain-containing protein [Elusimicrobiota bacterium]